MLLVGSVDWTWLRIESELADIGMENFKTERKTSDKNRTEYSRTGTTIKSVNICVEGI